MTMAIDVINLPTTGTYQFDPAHTVVGFVARHLVGTKVRGRFGEFSGSVTVADPVEQSSVEATVQAASIDTGVGQRDDHLRTNDFLDAPSFPTLSLRSTGVERVSDTELKVRADLTIRGVTKNVVFDVEVNGSGPGMAPDTEALSLTATTVIDRRDFGVSFNAALDAGGVVVGNKVTLELEVEAIKAS
jgi:polyisoprenoid-binding protein YceI